MTKIKVTWMDYDGYQSIHENGPKMAKDSYLGHILRKGGDWFFVQRDVEKPHGPYHSLMEVRRAAMHIVNGEYV